MQKQTKSSKKTFHAFVTDYKKDSTQKTLGRTRKENLLENIENYSRLKENNFTLQMSETIAAFAERTIRSMKNLFCPDMEDNGYKYNHKLI